LAPYLPAGKNWITLFIARLNLLLAIKKSLAFRVVLMLKAHYCWSRMGDKTLDWW
jgi:hypothetical protein